MLHQFVRPCDLCKRNALADLEPCPPRLKRIVQIPRCRHLGLRREIIAPKAVKAKIFEHHLPKGDLRRRVVGSVSADRTAHLQHLDIRIYIGSKRDLDNMINTVGSQSLHPLHEPLVIENHFMRARRPSYWFFRGRSHRANHTRAGMTRERCRTHSNSASRSLYQHRPPRHVAPDMDSAMSRDTGYPKARAFVRRHVLRERSNMI